MFADINHLTSNVDLSNDLEVDYNYMNTEGKMKYYVSIYKTKMWY